MAFDKISLVRGLKHLASAHTGNEFTGIMSKGAVTEFFIQSPDIISILWIKEKTDLPTGMVNSVALQAAIDQCKGTIAIVAEETEGAVLHIGTATLAMRDSPEIGKLDDNMEAIPKAIVNLMIARMVDTFTPVSPKSVFGWELIVKDGVASYGSANGAQAMYERSPIDADDFNLRIPHETCLRLLKIVGNCSSLSLNSRVLVVHQDEVRHYIPISSDAPSLSLKDVKGLMQEEIVLCKGKVDVKDKMLRLLAFADKDSQIVFDIKKGLMTASVTSKIGKNTLELAAFDPVETFNFQVTLQQALPLAKYTTDSVAIGVMLRNDIPRGLFVSFTKVGSKKAKTKEDDQMEYQHRYLASTSGR